MARRQLGATGTALVVVGLVAALTLINRPAPRAEPRPCAPDMASAVAVLMLSTSWCGYCKAARQTLQAKQIDWCELDIETSAEGAARHASVGGRGVPVFVSGDRVLHGFSKSGLANWLAESAGGGPQ